MYWGDYVLDKIEKANLDGTGRAILLQESGAGYFSFAYHAGIIYFTDVGRFQKYDYLVSSATNKTLVVAEVACSCPNTAQCVLKSTTGGSRTRIAPLPFLPFSSSCTMEHEK